MHIRNKRSPFLLILIILGSVLGSSCTADTDIGSLPESGTGVSWPDQVGTVHDLGSGISIELPAAWEVDKPFEFIRNNRAPEGCTQEQARIKHDDDGYVTLYLNHSNCDVPNQTISNDAPPSFVRAENAGQTDPIGLYQAQSGATAVINYDNFVCTNSCTNYTEPAAILTLDSPTDNNMAAVVIVNAQHQTLLNLSAAITVQQ